MAARRTREHASADPRPGPRAIVIAPARAPELISRAHAESLRRHGRFRELCLEQFRAGLDPRPEDVAAALREPLPALGAYEGVVLTPDELDAHRVSGRALADWLQAHVTEARRREARERALQRRLDEVCELAAYAATFYSRPRRSGRKPGAGPLARDLAIARAYGDALAAEREARASDSRRSAESARAIRARVARQHGISPRTLDTLVQGLSVRK